MPVSVSIIPCLEVMNGRLIEGGGRIDSGDPVAEACRYDAAGADELCLIDVAPWDRRTLLDVVERIADVCFMPLTVSGGVCSVDDAQTLLRAGADKVAIDSAAITDPTLIGRLADRFGQECVVVVIEACRIDDRWDVLMHGRWPTGLDAMAFARQVASLGAGGILLKSNDRDARGRVDFELLRRVSDAVPVPVIAAGSVDHLDDFVESVTLGHANAVLAASIFGQMTVRAAKAHMAAAGVSVRLI